LLIGLVIRLAENRKGYTSGGIISIFAHCKNQGPALQVTAEEAGGVVRER